MAAMTQEGGWFYEKNRQWPGQANGLQIKEVLLTERTKYQDLMVFESETWGIVLTLDGVIQLTERDEMSYQEMLAHIPMFSHSDPKRVLIVGGGDGGILREVCKHKCVESIVHCEIDEGVVNASRRFFPEMAKAFDDPRLSLKIDDAVNYVMKECADQSFDVVIVDSSDPDGPAEKLFSAEFYQHAARILSADGVVATQGECLWLNQDLIAELVHHAKYFDTAEYASIQVPTYPCGQIGAFVATKNDNSCERRSCQVPQRVPRDDTLVGGNNSLKYYTSSMHQAAFALPKFMEDRLEKERREVFGLRKVAGA